MTAARSADSVPAPPLPAAFRYALAAALLAAGPAAVYFLPDDSGALGKPCLSLFLGLFGGLEGWCRTCKLLACCRRPAHQAGQCEVLHRSQAQLPVPAAPLPPAAVAVQALVALTCIAGGGAAWGGATLLSTLQKS